MSPQTQGGVPGRPHAASGSLTARQGRGGAPARPPPSSGVPLAPRKRFLPRGPRALPPHPRPVLGQALSEATASALSVCREQPGAAGGCLSTAGPAHSGVRGQTPPATGRRRRACCPGALPLACRVREHREAGVWAAPPRGRPQAAHLERSREPMGRSGPAGGLCPWAGLHPTPPSPPTRVPGTPCSGPRPSHGGGGHSPCRGHDQGAC